MSYLDPQFSDARAPIQIVPLASAKLCEDCATISNPTTDSCPTCGSHALMSLARVLERESTQVQIMPLLSAKLCEDCATISNPTTDSCPTCGSHALMSLARVLDRSCTQEVQ